MALSLSFLPFCSFIFIYMMYCKLNSGGYDFAKNSKFYIMLCIYSLILFANTWVTIYKSAKGLVFYLFIMVAVTGLPLVIKIKSDDAHSFNELLKKDDKFKKKFNRYEIINILFAFIPCVIEIVNNLLIITVKFSLFGSVSVYNVFLVLYFIGYIFFIINILKFLKNSINEQKIIQTKEEK